MPWLVETIRRRNDDMDAISALLCRVIDPREYGGDAAEAGSLVEPVNALLAADGFVVGLEGNRPFARAKSGSIGRAALEKVAAALSSPALRARIRGLVSDDTLADVLVSRLDEVDAARSHGAYVLAIIGTGRCAAVDGVDREGVVRRVVEVRLGRRPALVAGGEKDSADGDGDIIVE